MVDLRMPHLPLCRTILLIGSLLIGSLALTGCANDRHTGAVIGGVVGATIGYVIATESDHHRDRDHHRKPRVDPYDHGHHPKRTGYHPPPRDPYCK